MRELKSQDCYQGYLDESNLRVSAEDEFRSLINNGEIAILQFKLTPEATLSKEQMAALTTYIISVDFAGQHHFATSDATWLCY